MTTNNQSITQEQQQFKALMIKVTLWAETNVPNEYSYNSRAVYWRSALQAGIISEEEYSLGQTHYAHLWTYVGD